MEEEEIVRSAQRIAAVLRFFAIYLGLVLLGWVLMRLHVVPLAPASTVGWWTLWLTMLPVSLLAAVVLGRLGSDRP
jgi:Na+(H+)/acetate symporter ActP